MMLNYQDHPEKRRDGIRRAYHMTLKATFVAIVGCALAFGAAVTYSLGHSEGYDMSQRETTQSAKLRAPVESDPGQAPALAQSDIAAQGG